MQSWTWGELKSRFGWSPVRLAVRDGAGREAGGLQMLIRRRSIVGFARLGIAYIPRGPFGAAGDDIYDALFATAAAEARAAGAWFLRVEPAAHDFEKLQGPLHRAGFVRTRQFVQIRATAYVDLRPDEEEILESFKSKTRYNVRLAARRGVRFREARSDADVDSFFALTVATGGRDGFAVHAKDYYRAVWKSFGETRGSLLLASFDGEDIAAILVVRCGDMATYLYGASSDRHRNQMPNHLLQWEAMRWAKAAGCSTYDFWGMDDGEAGDRSMAGVDKFKSGFDPQPVVHPGAFDLPLSPLGHAFLTRVLLPGRTRLQGLLGSRPGAGPPA